MGVHIFWGAFARGEHRGKRQPHRIVASLARCFRGRDKVLRERLYTYVVSDIKGVNAKHKDNALNRRLQTHVFAMLNDSSVVAAKYALRVLVQLYRRHVWRDTRTVNEWRAPDGQRFRSMRAAEAERKSASAATRTALPRVSLRPRPCCRR